MRELRDDQSEALERLRDAIGRKVYRVCMQAPTGFGKTVLAAEIVRHARERRKRVIYTVPALSLVDQTWEMFYQQGVHDVGIMQASHAMTDWSKPVQIASVQTLQRRPIPEADIVLLDEVHRWFQFYGKWLQDPKWLHVPIVGLSATPWSRGLGSYFKELIVAATTQDLINAGLLSDFKVFAPSHPDLSNVRTVAGDYHEGELSEAMSEGELVADVVTTWLKLAEDRPTLCYGVDRAHAKKLQHQFEAAGIRCLYQDALTKDHERKAIRKAFHNGEAKVVCNVGTLTTGIDWDVRCISLCRPTKSEMLFTQIVGRGLRTAEGKDFCLILDHSDNHQRLGFVTDIDASYKGLDDGKSKRGSNRADSIRLPKECPQCAFLKAPKTAKCPMCGFVATAQCDIEPVAGELRELKRPEKVEKVLDKRTFYAELKAYALTHGYKEGWASHKYRERVGCWPNHFKHEPPAGTISSETVGWIKSRMIAWARGRDSHV